MKGTSDSLSVRALRKYCRITAAEICQSLGIAKKVHVLALRIPFVNSDGFAVSIGLKNKRTNIVVANLWPYRASAVTSPEMTYFLLHSVIAHELKHVQIIQNWKNGICNFGEMFSEWAVSQICTSLSIERLIQNYLGIKGASSLKKKRYAVSPIELICYQYGFCEAFQRYEKKMNAEEHAIAKTMVDSINFINRHLEIDYYTSKQAYNRFTYTLICFSKFLMKHPGVIKKFPQLAYVFTNEGVLKSPISIFKQRTEETAEFIDSILIRLFITMEFDWTDTFSQCEALRCHLATLANDYCTEAINYLKGMPLGEVFLHEDVLQDNAAMLIKNTSRLNKLMEQYNMQHTAGSVLPLYYFDDFTKNRD